MGMVYVYLYWSPPRLPVPLPVRYRSSPTVQVPTVQAPGLPESEMARNYNGRNWPQSAITAITITLFCSRHDLLCLREITGCRFALV